MFSLIGWIFFGLIVGLIARGLVPGRQPMGCLRTILLGVAGSFLSGGIWFLLGSGTALQSTGWIGSIIGAIVLLVICARNGKFVEYE